MTYPRERDHAARDADFVSALIAIAGFAKERGLNDHCDVLDALADGAKVRLGVTA